MRAPSPANTFRIDTSFSSALRLQPHSVLKQLPAAGHRSNRVLCRGTFRDWVESLAYENWAPRCAQAWRLRPVPGEAELKGEQDIFNETALRVALEGQDIPVLAAAEQDTTVGGTNSSLDAALLDSLNSRIVALSAAGSFDEPSCSTQPLTGKVLRMLVYHKYGKTYDLSIVRRDIPGKTLVRLNVMWTHLEQKSFPMTEREFMEKLDIIAYHISAWQQESRVRSFFQQRPKAHKGLPARPTTGTAISIPLDLEQAVIEEWFSKS